MGNNPNWYLAYLPKEERSGEEKPQWHNALLPEQDCDKREIEFEIYDNIADDMKYIEGLLEKCAELSGEDVAGATRDLKLQIVKSRRFMQLLRRDLVHRQACGDPDNVLWEDKKGSYHVFRVEGGSELQEDEDGIARLSDGGTPQEVKTCPGCYRFGNVNEKCENCDGSQAKCCICRHIGPAFLACIGECGPDSGGMCTDSIRHGDSDVIDFDLFIATSDDDPESDYENTFKVKEEDSEEED